MLPYLTQEFGNPSSITAPGQRARAVIDESRAKVAGLLGAHVDEIVFTGSGTESINLALRGVAAAIPVAHLITSAIEHEAVLATAADLESSGHPVTIMPVTSAGLVDPLILQHSIRPTTALVSLMYANNEIGTIQPIQEIRRIVRRENRLREKAAGQRVYLHSDACQTPGYLSVNVDELGVDLLSLNAAKIGGPKGVGLLYVRRGTPFHPLITGGGQEFGHRAGTENVAAIVGFAAAFELASLERQRESIRVGVLRDRLLTLIKNKIPDVIVQGTLEKRLPNNLNLTIPGIDAEALVLYLDHDGVVVGTGSACSSRTLEPSHVLVAIGQGEAAYSTIRLSLGRTTTTAQVTRAASLIARRIAWLRVMTNPVKK